MNKYKDIISKLRYPLSFMKFKKYGKNIWLSRNGTIINAKELSFGDNIFINEKFHISAWNFSLGNNILIGSGFTALCNDHIYNKVGKSMFSYASEKTLKGITIENDVWIGANVTVLKGVKIYEGAIIGSGSIVTKDVAPYSISFGNPCKFYKHRFTKEKLEEHLECINSMYTLGQIQNIWKSQGVNL